MTILEEYENGQLSEEEIYRRLQKVVLDALLWFTAYFYIEKNETFESAYEKAVLMTSEQIRVKEIKHDGETVTEPYQFQKILQYDVNSFIPQELINERLPEFMKLMEDLKRSEPQNSDRTQELIDKIIRIFPMRKALDDVQPPLEQTKAKENNIGTLILPPISPKRLENFFLPTDKVSRTLLTKITVKAEEKATKISAEKKEDRRQGKKGDFVVLLYVDPQTGIKFSRALTSYERRIVQTIGNFWLNKQTIVTASQIYRAAFQDSNPPKREISKILEAVERLNAVQVTIDNREEVTKLKYKYDKVLIKGNLIAVTIVQAMHGGNVIENAIRINALPPTYEFAMPRNQYTEIPANLYKVPKLSQTEQTMRIIDYLIDRIVAMRNDGAKTRKINIPKLCEECGIKNKSTISKIYEKLGKILNHFKATEDFIKDYTIEDDNIVIKTFPPTHPQPQLTKKK